MLGGKQIQSHGYTIVETLIFLAVSGMMFVIAAVFISGKHEQVQFRSDVRTFSTSLESVLNTTTDAQYRPTMADLECNADTSTHGRQGTNGKCIFLGEMFYVDSAPGSSEDTYATQSISGDRQITVGGVDSNVVSLDQARPYFLNNSDKPRQSMGSLSVQLMCVRPVVGAPLENYGFAATLKLNGDVAPTGTGQNGSATRANIYAFNGAASPKGHKPSATDMYLPEQPLSRVDVYVTDGQRFADLRIDGNNGLSVTIKYLSAIPGVCS
jgi:hypothetical protein